MPETHIGTVIETQGYLNQPVEGKESILEGWKIEHAKNDPVDKRKNTKTLSETMLAHESRRKQ